MGISGECAQQKDLPAPEWKRGEYGQRRDFELATQDTLITLLRERWQRQIRERHFPSSRAFTNVDGSVANRTPKIWQDVPSDYRFSPTEPEGDVDVLHNILRLVTGCDEAIGICDQRFSGRLDDIGECTFVTTVDRME